MPENESEIFYPKTKQEWRVWLMENHQKKQSIWLMQFNKITIKPSVSWSDAVDEALCFGWIDSVQKKYGEGCTVQLFSKRKPNGTWSKINKAKIIKLVDAGHMMPAGLEVIEKAKKNGSWTMLDEVEELIIPQDLEIEFGKYSGSKDYFMSTGKSIQKAILQWLVFAKRPETRQKRIIEIVEAAAKKQKPKPFS